MGVSDWPKSNYSMSTRAKDSGKWGLEEVAGTPTTGNNNNKKKSTPFSASTGTAPWNSKNTPALPEEGTTPPSISGKEQSNDNDSCNEEVHENAVQTLYKGEDPLCLNHTDNVNVDLEKDSQRVNTKILNNHVALIMNKLNSIEGYIVTLSKDVSSLFSKMDEQSHQLNRNKTEIAKHSQQIADQSDKLKGAEAMLAEQSRQIGDLKKKQSSMVEEVNSNLGEHMESFKESLHKDNKLFRAELINMTNKKMEHTSTAIRAEVTPQ